MACRPDVAAILLQRGAGKCLKMRELLITIPVHKDRLSSLSRPYAVLQMFFCRSSAVLQISFNRSSCRLSAVLQSSLRLSSVVPLVVSLLSFSRPRLSSSFSRPSPVNAALQAAYDLTNKNPRRPCPACRGVYGSEGEGYSPLRFMRYL